MIIRDYYLEVLEKHRFPHHPLIHSIGYEKRERIDDDPYVWECRQSGESVCIFQYTIAGCGEISMNNKVYKLKPGDAFLIERPGPYRYYMPESSDLWEFKFISFTFSAMPFWNSIVNTFGHIISLGNEDNEILKMLDEILALAEASADQVKPEGVSICTVEPYDCFLDNSMTAFRFLNTMHKYLLEKGVASRDAESVQLCIEYICSNFHRNITNQDIARAGFISPYYLNKRFREVVGETPLQYLTKMRLKNAISMLQSTNHSIDTVARMCGFQNANYFAKVFKKYMGMTPTDFKKRGNGGTVN
ncbi:MAG: helix-turn-helix domain-containing protein [Ruminococcaceae bacterium]|nr:helix-turn-helix domain-containing protein [Oscillospiraceae bacterium]